VAIVAAMTQWYLKMCYFWVRSLYLVGDGEDDGLDGVLEVGVRSFLQKFGIILYFFFVESVVIGFAIVEIPSVVIEKKDMPLTTLPRRFFTRLH
jgi:hypothetical protein